MNLYCRYNIKYTNYPCIIASAVQQSYKKENIPFVVTASAARQSYKKENIPCVVIASAARQSVLKNTRSSKRLHPEKSGMQ